MIAMAKLMQARLSGVTGEAEEQAYDERQARLDTIDGDTLLAEMMKAAALGW